MRADSQTWTSWDQAVLDGKAPHDVVPFLEDERIIELLASGHPETRQYELRILSTELANRLVRFRRLVEEASAEGREAVEDALHAADRAEDSAGKTLKGVEHHIEVRRDQIGDEPRDARTAASATKETREALEGVQRAGSALARAKGEVGRTARDVDEA